jgi:23S rRNA pseudouridine1911/1915/1917 synthase
LVHGNRAQGVERNVKQAENYRDDASEDPQALEAAESDAEQRAFTVDAALHGQRLDKALVRHAGEFSRSHLQQLILQGDVSVDAQACTSPSKKLRAGQQVLVILRPTEESQAFVAEPMALPVLFEDEHLLVINKPAGWVVHPAPGNWRGTVLNGLLAHHALAATLPRAGIVHRLDKDTSGVMVVAKTLPTMTALVRALAAREVQREYLAIAHGGPRNQTFSVEQPIGRDPVSRVKMAVLGMAQGGKAARTDFACLGELDKFSLWRCKLHTGRTHQIRVHAASVGHPLVADSLYGGAPALGLQRQALHAARLRFAHPATGADCTFLAPLPPDLALAWQALDGPALDRALVAVE